jgi:DNA-binding transcriptional LysR family regulator
MADFKAIETFMWVATLGSFRGAAQKLNTTQPAISQRIAQLEREVGVNCCSATAAWCFPHQADGS